ncbi:MAG TPA: hypothetical protein VNV86_17375 [Candidatus Acidoferrum sp.]|nr:hypothetical protein [Candidatus Acidoferrum sp.]
MVAQAVSPALPILDDFCRGLLVIFGFGSAYGTIQYEQDALTTPEPGPDDLRIRRSWPHQFRGVEAPFRSVLQLRFSPCVLIRRCRWVKNLVLHIVPQHRKMQ